jgi:HSP20 family protein
MEVTRWSPFQELDALERRMTRLFDEAGFTGTVAVLPAADIYETADEFVVELEVPGFDEKELAIHVTDHTLSVKGERTEAKETKEKDYRRRERLEKTFERRFFLPTEADLDALKAEYKKGVLEIHTPKAQTLEPRKIEIGKET